MNCEFFLDRMMMESFKTLFYLLWKITHSQFAFQYIAVIVFFSFSRRFMIHISVDMCNGFWLIREHAITIKKIAIEMSNR